MSRMTPEKRRGLPPLAPLLSAYGAAGTGRTYRCPASAVSPPVCHPKRIEHPRMPSASGGALTSGEGGWQKAGAPTNGRRVPKDVPCASTHPGVVPNRRADDRAVHLNGGSPHRRFYCSRRTVPALSSGGALHPLTRTGKYGTVVRKTRTNAQKEGPECLTASGRG